MQVVRVEEDIPNDESPEPDDEDTFTGGSDLIDEFPF
jgi:hypothetical protein